MAMQFADNIEIGLRKPDFTRQEYATIADMATANENKLPEMYIGYCLEDHKFYYFDKSAEVDATTGKWRALTGAKDVQVSVMPEGNDDNANRIVQYTGETSASYTNGYFYKCTATGSETQHELVDTLEKLNAKINVSEVKMSVVNASGKPVNRRYWEFNGTRYYNISNVNYYTTNETGDVSVDTAIPDDEACAALGIDIETTVITYDWVNVPTGPGGGGGGGSLTSDLTASVDVGGIKSGTTLPQNTPLETVFRKMLAPMSAPTFTFAGTPAGGLFKKGTVIPLTKFTVNVTALGNNTSRKYSITPEVATDVDIPDTGVYEEEVTAEITSNTTYTCTISYTDSAETAAKNATVAYEFVDPYYYGDSDSSSVVDFTGLSELIKKKGTQVASYTAANKYLVFAYPASYGNLTSIKDPNNFENLDAWDKSSLEVDGVNYFVYVSHTPITCTNFKYTFSY